MGNSKSPMYRGGAIDLDELEGLARAASPGPWRSWVEGRDHVGGDHFISTDDDASGGGGSGPDLYPRLVIAYSEWNPNWQADQDYIAAVNPTVVLELISQLRDRRA
jgi:hypothetical protein